MRQEGGGRCVVPLLRMIVDACNHAIHVVHVISGLKQGGAEAVLHRLIVASAPRVRHTVISMLDEGFYGAVLRAAGADVVTLKATGARPSWRIVRDLYRAIRELKPDVVQTWMYHANLLGGVLARLVGVRTVIWGIHNATLDKSLVGRATRIVSVLSAKLSAVVPAAVVYVSDGCLKEHEKVGYKSPVARIINNGVNLACFVPNAGWRVAVRQRWKVCEEEILLGCVARWDVFKDHENLFRALALLAKKGLTCRCALIGPGMSDDNECLTKRIAAYGLEDRLILVGPTEDVPGAMNALDLHVLSSCGESFGNVVAEAMACGVPCVATDVGAIKLIMGETGWIVPPRNAHALAHALETGIRSLRGPMFPTLKSACRERVSRLFSIESMAQAYVELWMDLAEK